MAYTNFSFMRPGNGDGEGDIPIETRRKMAEDERQKYLAFMQHPSYKKRLLMEMFGKEANLNSAEQQQALEKEYGRRVNTISGVPIRIKKNLSEAYGLTYPGEKNTRSIVLSGQEKMATNPEQFQDVVRHELGHAVNNGIVGRGGNKMNPIQDIMNRESSPGRKAIADLMQPFPFDLYWDEGEKEKAIKDATKEFGTETVNKVINLRKLADDDTRLFRKRTIDEWPEFHKILHDDTFYALYQNPTEAAARLGNIRRLAAEKFGHDMNEDFDIKKYGPQIEKFYKEKNVKSPLKDLKEQGFSDEAINEMMKYIAKAERQPSVSRYTA